MKFIITYILIMVPICMTVAQKHVYLKNNETGQLKKLNRKSILTFKTSDSTSVTGRIISVTDSSFSIATYEKKHVNSETVNVQIKSVSQVTNKLINKKTAPVVGVLGYIGLMGLSVSPVLLLTETPEDALGAIEGSAVFLGAGAIMASPRLIKRKFDTKNKWTLVTK